MQHLFVAYEKVLSLRKQAGIDIDRQVSIATKSCDGIEFYTLSFESRYPPPPFFFFVFTACTVEQDSVMVNHVPLNTSLKCVLLQRGFFCSLRLAKFGCQIWVSKIFLLFFRFRSF